MKNVRRGILFGMIGAFFLFFTIMGLTACSTLAGEAGRHTVVTATAEQTKKIREILGVDACPENCTCFFAGAKRQGDELIFDIRRQCPESE